MRNALKYGVAAACGYEVVAIFAGLPTISHEVGVYPWLGAVILGALTYHFYGGKK